MKKTIKLNEGRLSASLQYDWLAAIQENKLNHPSEIANFLEEELTKDEDLLGYYTNMLQQKPEDKEYFDFELRSRDLDAYIAPTKEELAYYSKPEKITRDLVMEVVEAKSFNRLLGSLRTCYGGAVNARLCAALLIALCLNKTELAKAIKGHISKIGTYTREAKAFLDTNATEAVTNRIIQLYNEYNTVINTYRNKMQVKESVGRRVIKLTEATASLTPYEKMDLFNQGKRRENIKACKMSKLLPYYKICLENHFNIARQQIEAEILDRGHTAYLCPSIMAIDSTQFTPYEAQYICKYANNPTQIVETAYMHPFPGLTVSDTLTVYLIWSLVLNFPDVTQALKDQMKKYDTYYGVMPEVLNELISEPSICKILSDIIKGLPKDLYENISEEVTEKLEMQEDIEKHDELNPLLFDESKQLRKEIRSKALEVTDELIAMVEENGITLNIKDIVITGSNASYNYTKDSDIDLHLIADLSDKQESLELYQALFNSFKTAFNNKYDIDFYGLPVEVYIETADTAVVSNGIYSIQQDTWVQEPTNTTIPDIDLDLIDKELQPWINRFEQLTQESKSGKIASEEPIEKFIDDLYAMREEGLHGKEGNEYSTANLVFKEFRNLGYLEKVKELRDEVISTRLSIEK